MTALQWLLTDDTVRLGATIAMFVLIGGAAVRRIHAHLSERDLAPARRGRTVMVQSKRNDARDYPMIVGHRSRAERARHFRSLRLSRDWARRER